MQEYGKHNQSSEKMALDIRSILIDIVRNWWILLLAGASAAMLLYSAVSFMYQPEYTVSTTFVVKSKGSGSNAMSNISAASETARMFSAVLENSILQKKVQEDLGVDQINAKTSTSLVQESNLLQLSVAADTPQMAFLVLKSILKNYPSVSDYIMPDVVLITLEAPVISDTPSNQLPVRRYMEYAFLAAAAAVAAIFGMCSYMRDTVKNVQEFPQKIDGDLLGTIYHEKKKRRARSMLITNSLHSMGYVEGYHLLATRIKGRMDKRSAKVMMITSAWENEGKSTVSANLAIALAQGGSRVLLMDCDFRKPALYKLFEVKPDCTRDLSDVVQGKADSDNLLGQVGKIGLYVAFCYRPLGNSTEVLGNGNLEAVIADYYGSVDYIILDTPPMALVADAEEFVKMADAAILVVRQDQVLARDINDALDALDGDGKVLGCVYSNVHTLFHEQTVSGAYSYYGNHRD